MKKKVYENNPTLLGHQLYCLINEMKYFIEKFYIQGQGQFVREVRGHWSIDYACLQGFMFTLSHSLSENFFNTFLKRLIGCFKLVGSELFKN